MAEKLTNAVKGLTELVAMVESAMSDIVNKTKRMDQRIQSNQRQLSILTNKLIFLEKKSKEQRKAFQKIDKITEQLDDLKTMVYETGLVVVGPDKIEKLEKKLKARKAKKNK